MKILYDDTAVSESLSFMLIAFISMLALSVIVMIGYPMYQNAISESHLKNMEEGFYLLSANANKVVMYESPIQSSELKLYGGTLWLREEGDFIIEYTHTVGGNPVMEVYNGKIPVMEYLIANNRIAYVMGGVCKRDGQASSIMIRDPLAYTYTTTDNKKILVMPMIAYSSTEGALSGNGLTRVTISSPYYLKTIGTLNYPNSSRINDVTNIKITMNSEYTDCFSRYFQSLGFSEVSNLNGVLVMTCNNAQTLYIVPSKIQINID